MYSVSSEHVVGLWLSCSLVVEFALSMMNPLHHWSNLAYPVRLRVIWKAWFGCRGPTCILVVFWVWRFSCSGPPVRVFPWSRRVLSNNWSAGSTFMVQKPLASSSVSPFYSSGQWDSGTCLFSDNSQSSDTIFLCVSVLARLGSQWCCSHGTLSRRWVGIHQTAAWGPHSGPWSSRHPLFQAVKWSQPQFGLHILCGKI